MLTYWSMFLVPALLAVARIRVSTLGWWILGGAIALLVGLRYEVGGDWIAYLGYLQRIKDVSLSQIPSLTDPSFQLLNWVCSELGASVWLVNLFAGSVFAVGLIIFVRTLPNPLLALVVAIPYMTIVLAMGYTRQAIAFGFILWGLTYLVKRHILIFVFFLALASSFHKSAVILMPLAVLANQQSKIWAGIWVSASGALLYWLFLAERVDSLWYHYVASEYSQVSSGGPIRVVMNVLPAVLFIIFQKRFYMRREERMLWFWISVFSLLCLPLVFQASTAVDRVALYFMPIQLVVFSYLPRLFKSESRTVVHVVILGFYGMVQLVWLNYSATSFAWLPYKIWPVL